MFFRFRKNKEDVKNKNGSEKKRFSLPTLEITPERAEEIIEQIAGKIRKYGLEAPALLLLIPLQPLSPIAGQLGLLPFAPLLEAFDLPGFDYVSFFSKPENVSRLIKKIEQKNLKEEEGKEKEESKNDDAER